MTTESTHLITLDNKLSLSEAARTCGMSPSGIFRWIQNGMDGVHLEHIRLGARIYTSAPALEQFGREVAEAKTRKRQERKRSADRPTVEAGL